ncbi:MAG: long-chain fatty acid--CoA ligase, partial [Flavobacteriaceae bacterium]
MINNLAHLIEQTAIKFPDKEAFRCLEKSYSYADLNQKSAQLASLLIQNGLRKGDRVAIYMNRCIETSIAVYGILKAGGAFVAINPFLPVSRTLEIMVDCGIEQLITTTSQTNKIKKIAAQAPFLKKIFGISEDILENAVSWETVFSTSLDNFDPQEILELDLASILYTSGSTGTPKGIMHTHKSLLNLARLEADLHSSTPEDRIGNFAPLHFDQSLFGYFSGPLVGATTVIFPDAYVKLPASLAALVAKERISLWFSVPHILIQILLHGNIDEHDFSALRWIRFGGEVFPVKQLRELMIKWPHAKFINSYGPSELARCTYYILEEPPKTDDPIPLGTVWGNTEYRILDENNADVKKGEPGELVVRTATLMAGYWNNPELTEKAFFRLKVAEGYDYIYYRTGDLVRENNKGQLMF